MIALTEIQQDILKEIINLGVGKAASTLNTILNKHIILSVPFVKLLSYQQIVEEIRSEVKGKISSVDLLFRGELCGFAKLFFPSESASKLVKAFVPDLDEDEDIDALTAGTLAEIGNIVLNSLVGSLSNQLGIDLSYSTPQFLELSEETAPVIDSEIQENGYILARTSFLIDSMAISGNFVLYLEIESLNYFLKVVDQIAESI